MKWSELLISSKFFRGALIANGLGTCSLAIAFPYFLFNSNLDPAKVFHIQALIFLFAAIGTYLWGHVLDNSKNIWKLKNQMVILEILFSVLTFLSFNLEIGLVWQAILLIGLEFLFAFEIPWSRLAYSTIPENLEKEPSLISREITITAASISIVAPAIGAFSTNHDRIELLTLFNIFTFIPYMINCYFLSLKQKKTKEDLKEKTDKVTTQVLMTYIFKESSLFTFYLSIIPVLLIGGLFISVLPYLLHMQIKPYGEFAIPVFYIVTGFLAFLINTEKFRGLLPKVLTDNVNGIILTMSLTVILFILVGVLWVKVILYTSYNILFICYNMILMKRIYDVDSEKIKGRLFSLLQLIIRIVMPVSAIYLSWIEHDLSNLLTLTFGTLFLVGVILIYIDSKKQLFYIEKELACE